MVSKTPLASVIHSLILDDGTFPNNGRLPLLLYQGAIDLPTRDPARLVEELFDSHRWSGSWIYHLADRSYVYVWVQNDKLPLRPLVALTVSRAWILERTRLEDGRWLADTDLELQARCQAKELKPGQDPWEAAAGMTILIYAKRGRDYVASGKLRLRDQTVVLRPSGRHARRP